MKKKAPNNQNMRSREVCANPWRKCGNTDIIISIKVNNEILPICSQCWNEIADSSPSGEERCLHIDSQTKAGENSGSAGGFMRRCCL